MSCLDRDSAHWGLSPKMTQRRRILFWELFISDVWQVCPLFPLLYFCPTNKIRALTLEDPHHSQWHTAIVVIHKMAPKARGRKQTLEAHVRF